jgi:hypothetical protein
LNTVAMTDAIVGAWFRHAHSVRTLALLVHEAFPAPTLGEPLIRLMLRRWASQCFCVLETHEVARIALCVEQEDPDTARMLDQLTQIETERAALHTKLTLPTSQQDLDIAFARLASDPFCPVLVALCRGNPRVFPSTPRPPGRIQEHSRPAAVTPPLEVYTAEVESRLLVAAGWRNSPVRKGLRIKSPVCFNRDKCIGLHSQINGFPISGGAALMARMRPHELEQHESTGFVPERFKVADWERGDEAALPCAPGWLCVLCARKDLTMLVIQVRLLGLLVSVPISSDSVALFCFEVLRHRRPVDNPEIVGRIQWFTNPCDVPGGYAADLCLDPAKFGMFTGLSAPVAAFVHDRLYARHDTAQDAWVIDQSAMFYQPPDLDLHAPFALPALPHSTVASDPERRGGDPQKSSAYLLQLFPRAAVSVSAGVRETRPLLT